MANLTKEQIISALTSAFQSGDMTDVAIVKQGKKDKMFALVNVSSGQIGVTIQGEKVYGRLSGNLFLQGLSFTPKTNGTSDKPKPQGINLNELKNKKPAA